MIKAMRKKVEEEDKKYFVMKPRRNHSEDNMQRWSKAPPLMRPGFKENLPEHPLQNQRDLQEKVFLRVSS